MAVFAGLLAAAWAGGQDAGPVMRAGPVYTSADGRLGPKFPRLDVVFDIRGAQAADAASLSQPANFRLVENSIETLGHLHRGWFPMPAVSVRRFEETGYPVTAVIALDASGSMRGAPLQAIRQSLYRFVSDARPQDQVAVLTFADETRWDVDFDSSRAHLQEALAHVQSRGHYTHLYDAIVDALNRMAATTPQRRELIVISDGHDEGSTHTEAEVVDLAGQYGIAIDSIGLTRSDPRYLASLETISLRSGGVYHAAADYRELEQLIANGLAAMKASPVATFETSEIPADGMIHPLTVFWRSPQGDHPQEIAMRSPLITPVPSASAPAKSDPAKAASALQNRRIWLGALAILALLAIALVFLKRKKVTGPAPIPPHPCGGVLDPPPPQPKPQARPQSIDPEPLPVPQAIPAEEPRPAIPRRQTRMVSLFDQTEPGGVVAWLEAVSGDLQGKEYPVGRKEFWIGAAETNNLPIPEDSTVSWQHVSLHYDDGVLMIADNNSTNGTRINGAVLRGGRRSLAPGDEIQIGRSKFVVRASSNATPGKS